MTKLTLVGADFIIEDAPDPTAPKPPRGCAYTDCDADDGNKLVLLGTVGPLAFWRCPACRKDFAAYTN